MNIWGFLQYQENEKAKADPNTLQNIQYSGKFIFRYMSLGKFINLLSQKNLFFPQLSKMTELVVMLT